MSKIFSSALPDDGVWNAGVHQVLLRFPFPDLDSSRRTNQPLIFLQLSSEMTKKIDNNSKNNHLCSLIESLRQSNPEPGLLPCKHFRSPPLRIACEVNTSGFASDILTARTSFWFSGFRRTEVYHHTTDVAVSESRLVHPSSWSCTHQNVRVPNGVQHVLLVGAPPWPYQDYVTHSRSFCCKEKKNDTRYLELEKIQLFVTRTWLQGCETLTVVSRLRAAGKFRCVHKSTHVLRCLAWSDSLSFAQSSPVISLISTNVLSQHTPMEMPMPPSWYAKHLTKAVTNHDFTTPCKKVNNASIGIWKGEEKGSTNLRQFELFVQSNQPVPHPKPCQTL